MTRRRRPKRARCEWCERTRLIKFMEWHPGCECWQCKDEPGCRGHSLARNGRRGL